MIDGKEVFKAAFCAGISRAFTDLLFAMVVAFALYICLYVPELSVSTKQFAMVVFWCMTIMLAIRIVADLVVEKYIDKIISMAQSKGPKGGLNP